MSIDLVFHLPRMCHYPEAHGRLGWGGRAQFDFIDNYFFMPIATILRRRINYRYYFGIISLRLGTGNSALIYE
jgi:hypothetical protein